MMNNTNKKSALFRERIFVSRRGSDGDAAIGTLLLSIQFDSRILSKLDKQQKDFRRSPFVVYQGANQTEMRPLGRSSYRSVRFCLSLYLEKQKIAHRNERFFVFQGANQNRTDE